MVEIRRGPERRTAATAFATLTLLLLSSMLGAPMGVQDLARATGPSLAPIAGSVPSSNGTARAVNWTNVSGALSGQPPVTRCCSSMVYDAKDGYSVLFGGGSTCQVGCNRTFLERGSTWVALPLGTGPSPREWASMAYDPFDGYVLLFGGLSLNGSVALADTWAFSAGAWKLLPQTSSPVPRWAAGISADPQDGYMVLFGGYSPSAGFLQDTWAFVNGSWQQVFPSNSPPARWTPAMSYDPELGATLLFGGYSGTLGFLGDTWTYRGGAWTQLPTGQSPGDREKAMMTYDAADQAMVLFGGDICPVGCGNGLPTRYYNDTWTFSNGLWRNATTFAAPPAQCCGAMSYAWNTGELLLLAHNRSATGAATTWVATLSPPPTGAPHITAFEVAPFEPTTILPTSFLVEARPSSGALSYSYQGLPPGCSSQNTSLLSCTVTAAGTYTVAVTVTDTSGRSTQISTTVQVSWGARPPAPSPPPPDLWPWFIVAGVVGVAVIVSLALFQRRKKGPRGGKGRSDPDQQEMPAPDEGQAKAKPEGVEGVDKTGGKEPREPGAPGETSPPE